MPYGNIEQMSLTNAGTPSCLFRTSGAPEQTAKDAIYVFEHKT